VPAIAKAGIVDALVAKLGHKSPHCVGAAAASLYMIDGLPGGHALVGASGAIPALVRVLERAQRPGEITPETPMGHRCVHEYVSVGTPQMKGCEFMHGCSFIVEVLHSCMSFWMPL
jgi:hypothetical protein